MRRVALLVLLLGVVVLGAACADGGNDQEPPSYSSTMTAEQSTATPSADASPTPTATPPPAITTMEQRVVARINEIRRERGLEPLEPLGSLASIARNYSCKMAEENFFTHVSPSGNTVGDRLHQADLRYRLVGENLARNTNAENPARVAVQGWLDSEAHRQNLLREAFTQTGVGICRDGDRYYFTQIFRTPR